MLDFFIQSVIFKNENFEIEYHSSKIAMYFLKQIKVNESYNIVNK